MRLTDFDIYHELLRERSGLEIAADQTYLLEARLSPIAKKWGYPTLDAMTIALQGVTENEELLQDIIEAMTNTDTAFFADKNAFDMLENVVIPILQKKRKKKHPIKIWSAGCSTGQEPYSIAMLINEMREHDFAGWKTEIIASDLSSDLLQHAEEGTFTQFEMQRGLSIKRLMENFYQKDDVWQLKPKIHGMVSFQKHNLLSNSNAQQNCDVIFAVNILNDFSTEAKVKALKNLVQCLAPDGFLILGENDQLPKDLNELSAMPGAYEVFTRTAP